MSVTLNFQNTGRVPGSARPVAMRGNSLTVGRGDENDLTLPDPDNMISRNHCVIEAKGDLIVVTDLSSNGTFLNYSKTPLGKREVPLNDGDILSVGPYELVVAIGGPAAAVDPLSGIAPPMRDPRVVSDARGQIGDIASPLDGSSEHDDFLDDLLKQPTNKGTAGKLFPETEEGILPPLGDEDDPLLPSPSRDRGFPGGASYGSSGGPTGDQFSAPGSSSSLIPEDFDNEFKPKAKPPEAVQPTPPATQKPEADAPPRAEPVERKPPVAENRPPVAQNVSPETAHIFLAALGVDPKEFPDEDLPETMERLGHVLNRMIVGIREILMTRASIKSEFPVERTMIKAAGNNPLKFSVSEEQALSAMARATVKGYLDASAATEEALHDIRAHEVGMVTGMQAALTGVLKQLDPEKLETRIGRSQGLSGLMKGQKARYWEAYKQMYGEIAEQSEENFMELFSREFARAYLEQMKKMK